MKYVLKSKLAVVGFSIIAVVLIMCACARWVSPFDPQAFSSQQLHAPSTTHPLGTDSFGADLLALILNAGFRTVGFAVVTLLFSAALGIPAGVIGGFVGGKTDMMLSRVVEVMLSFPVMVAALLVIAVFGSTAGQTPLLLAISVTLAPRFARVMRGATLPLRETEFVMAARAAGASRMRILFRHLVPNLVAPILVLCSAYLPYVILLESSLSFLGLGAPPDMPTWGRLVAEGRKFFRTAPWAVFFPGAAITLVAIGFNLLGDGLRDALDPHARRKLVTGSR
jgi:peptide/nickel transport system permease protein